MGVIEVRGYESKYVMLRLLLDELMCRNCSQLHSNGLFN